MLDIFSKIQKARNFSEWTTKYFKSKKNRQIKVYLIAKNLAELEKLKESYRGHDLIIGYCEQDKSTGKPFICHEMNGNWLPNIYCRKGSGQPSELCFSPSIYIKGSRTRVVALDVTEDFIKKYNKIGKCLLHDSDHQLVKSKSDWRKKSCKICKKKYSLKIKVVHEEDWVEDKT